MIILQLDLRLNTKQDIAKDSTPKEKLQKSLKAFAQVKAGNTSENLLNEITEFIYSLYQAK